MKKKLKSQKGVSFTEMLVALLIVGLVSAGMVTGVTGAIQTYRQSVQYTEAQLLASTLSDAILHELRFARELGKDAAGNVTFTSDLYGKGVYFDANAEGQITLGDGKTGQLLVGDGAYSAGSLKAEVRVAKVQVAEGTAGYDVTLHIMDAGGKPLYQADFSVVPFNTGKK